MIDVPPADVIVVDFPWRYRNWSDTARGAAAAHYVGMTYEQGKALAPVMEQLRKPDSIIIQWTTWPKLDQGIDLLRDWGWSYVSGFPWIKTVADLTGIKRTVGFWSMGCSEVVLIGRTGSVGASQSAKLRCKKGHDLEGGNVMGLLCGSERQFYDRHAKRVKDGTTHSHKPYGIAEWLEEKFEDAVFTELFATQERPGWNTIGHRCGSHIDPTGVMSLEEAIQRDILPADYDPFREPIRKGQKRSSNAPAELGDHKSQTEGYIEVIQNMSDRDIKQELVSPEMSDKLHDAMMDF